MTRKALLVLYLYVLFAVLSTGCAQKFNFGHINDAQKQHYINRYWADAQELLEDKTNGTSVVVPHTIVRWYWSKQLIIHDGKPTYGMFNTDMRVWIVEFRPWTIRHEACHAILYHLEHQDWIEYCHTGEEWK